MKNLCSCLILLIFLNSCSDDTGINATDDQIAVTVQPLTNALNANRLANEMPANSDNPYDNAGKLHNEILSGYYNGTVLPIGLSAIRDRVMVIANSIAGFNDSKGSAYHEVQLVKVQSILNNPTGCVSDIIYGTGMSIAGKISLTEFTNNVLLLANKEEDYKVIYDSICVYESSILADALLTTKDKKIILTATSIARYSISAAKKRPKKNTDPDWTIFIANITGGIYGADTDTAEATSTALVCGIAQN